MSATMSDSNGWSFGSKRSLLRTSRDRVMKEQKSADDLKRFEESVFIRRARAEERRNRRLKERRFLYMIIAAVIVLFALAAHLTYQTVVGLFPNLMMSGMGKGHATPVSVSSFQLAGVAPGMTPAQVKKVHPDADVQVSDLGITLMKFDFRDADVKVWYLGQGDGQHAFRIRSNQSFDAAREEDVLNALALKFGRPTTSDCDASNVTARQDCQFGWRAESIDLKATTRIVQGNRLELSILAEDIKLRALLNRKKTTP